MSLKPNYITLLKNGSLVFPARESFRAVPRMISAPCQAERPSDNRGKFRWQSGKPGVARSSSLLGYVGGIDDPFPFNGTVHNRLVAQRVDCPGDAGGAMKDLHLGVLREQRAGIVG